MDNAILRKRLNTFKTAKGTLRQVSDEVIMEVLRAWENWPGKAVELYRDLGLSKMQLVTMIQKAKRLVKSGAITESEFKEITANIPTQSSGNISATGAVEILYSDGKIIRFAQVDLLVEFLKKAA